MSDQEGGSAFGGQDASSSQGSNDAPDLTKVYLAALDSGDVQTIRVWRNDPRIYDWCRQNDFISDLEQAQWFERMTQDPSTKMYAIKLDHPTQDGTVKPHLVGVAGLTSIDYRYRRAEFSLYVAPDLHGRGLGKAALLRLLDHGFKKLNLNLIWGEVLEGNPAFELYKEIGFVHGGDKRDFYFKKGKWLKAHFLDIRSVEWETLGPSLLSSLHRAS